MPRTVDRPTGVGCKAPEGTTGTTAVEFAPAGPAAEV